MQAAWIREKIDEVYAVVKKNKGTTTNLMSYSPGDLIFLKEYIDVYETAENELFFEKKIRKHINNINNGYTNHTFSTGLAGFCWGLDYLKKGNYIEVDVSDVLQILDGYLETKLYQEFAINNYDYLHGALGITLYFLKHPDSEIRSRIIDRTIEFLDSTAIKDDKGVKWLSVINYKTGEKGYNLSLSHGVTSILGILHRIIKISNNIKAKALADGIVEALLAAENNFNEKGHHFPNCILLNKNDDTKSRLAWCYGDLGIGYTLYNYGNLMNNENYKDKGLEVLLNTTQRKDRKENFVTDAGLCHGTAGILHIYNKLYKQTQITEFKTAAEYWLSQTLHLLNHKDIGSKKYDVVNNKYINEYGLLEGKVGIGLALLAYLKEEDVDWDECLLL